MRASKILLITLLTFICGSSIAQNCKLKGIVQYKFNDNIGYKIDVGAEVYVVLKEKLPNFKIETWEKYENAAKVSIEYWEYLNEPAGAFPPLDNECKKQFEEASELFEDVSLVDATGNYQLTLPYGEYYIFAISKNRNRSFSNTEKENRIIVKEVILDKPIKILSIDFDY